MIRILLLLLCQTSWAAPLVVVKDLRPDWLHYTDETYLKLEASSASELNTIYFSLNEKHFEGQHLLISSIEVWDLYVNGKLIYSGREQLFSVDSLSQLYAPLFFGIHSSVTIQQLKTQIVSLQSGSFSITPTLSVRPPTFFRDYSIIASAILFIFLLFFNHNYTYLS